jgi:hypothetical protein
LRNQLGDLCINAGIILKCTLKETGCKDVNTIKLAQNRVHLVSFYEHDDEELKFHTNRDFMSS